MGDPRSYHGWLNIPMLIPPSRADISEANFTLPKTTPPGKYLLRLEVLFGITHEFNVTQFYINCAHIEVNGSGGGKTPCAVDLAELIFAQESLAQWSNSRVRTTSGITVRLTTEKQPWG